MALASEILARAHEHLNGPFPELSDRDLVKQLLEADRQLGLLQMLRTLNAADQEVTGNRNTILIFSSEHPLEIRTFRDAPDALRELFELEREMPERDVVPVRADTGDDVRIAFRNYFSDAGDFIRLVEDGCTLLSRAVTVSGGSETSE